VVFLVVPAGIFDFYSFSFQVPICGPCAKEMPKPKMSVAKIESKDLFMILPLLEDVID